MADLVREYRKAVSDPHISSLEKRITELERALQKIADGYVDDGGNRKVRSDSILIARQALGLK